MSDPAKDAAEAALTSMVGYRDQAARFYQGLRNCLALAVAKQRNPNRGGDWADIERFCAEVGVTREYLRSTESEPS